MDFLLDPALFPFTVSAGVLVGLVAVELSSLMMGFSLSDATEGALDADHAGFASLDWLNVGRVPLMILAMVSLASFSLLGMSVQAVAAGVGGPLPTWGAAAVAALASVPVVRVLTRAVAAVVPRDETYAIEMSDLVGSIAVVGVGPLDQSLPGTARVLDGHGNWHVVRARAAEGTRDMAVGEEVVLVSEVAGTFLAIPFAPASPIGDAVIQPKP
jgi:hypothetical protein